MRTRVEYDLQYLRKWSLGLDLKIIVARPSSWCFSTVTPIGRPHEPRDSRQQRPGERMNNKRSKPRSGGALCAVSGTVLSLALASASAQDAAGSLTGTVAQDPNPYYVGVGEALTHDSNVYRIPSGPGDNYSSTSVFGGFNQPISRQRVYGRAGVSLNRYQDQTQLNHTSYDLGLGANLATIENISGNVSVGLSQNLASPSSPGALPTATRNIQTTERANARLRWGGPSLLSLEGSLGYVSTDYSAPQFITSESRETTGSIGLYYNSGAYLRVGVAGRFEHTRTPSSVFDPVSGTYLPNSTDGRNLDLLVDYTIDQLVNTHARLSYTRQTNSLIAASDFSGLTGSLVVHWQPTAKTGVQFDISRVAGFEANSLTRYAAVQSGSGLILTPVPVVYQNNRVTDSAGLGVTYSATAKISATAGARYTRARLAAAIEVLGIPQDVDVSKTASLSVRYAITRAWDASCSIAYETRDVTFLTSYSYTANTFGCATQFTWR
jgi:hypothetical protein